MNKSFKHESTNHKSNRKIITIILICFSIVSIIGISAFFIYTLDYSRAGEVAIAALEDSSNTVTLFKGGVAIGDVKAKNGFIFYPGGKVEHTAYAPVLKSIADSGVLCIITKMPFQLAVFDIDAAADIIPMFPEIEHWFIGGHSLGGAMAADYASKNPEDFDGLILLASYSATDLTKTNLKVISMFGSEDQVLNMENFEKSRSIMPEDYEEVFIEGGNHAQFGDYGLQDGDGLALITEKQQREITSVAIVGFITGKDDRQLND